MTLPHDCRLAARTWLRTPGLAATVVVTLSLGIGATTAAFTLAYTILIKPLPFPDTGQLVWVSSYNTRASSGSGGEAASNRLSQFNDWRQHARSFEQLGAWAGEGYDIYTITGSGTSERVNGLEVTQQLLPMLGATTALGTLFHDGDDRPEARPTVVLTHGFWERRFGSRPDVIGQTMTIDNAPHTIIGVLRDNFSLSSSLPIGAPLDIYLPLVLDPRKEDYGFFMTVIGRLRPGASTSQARGELATRQQALATERPFLNDFAQQLTPLAGPVTRAARTPLLLLVAGVGTVLLMACANLAHLLLIRSAGRRREIQLRTALGATTRQVFAQMLTESCLLAVIGGAAGMALAFVLTRVLRSAAWLDLPRLSDVRVGSAALIVTVAISAAVAIVFGCLPLLHVRRGDLVDALRPHGGLTPDRRAVRLQRLALIGQVSFAMTLTVGGLLLVKSVAGLRRVDPGFRPEGAIAIRVDPASRLRVPDRIPFFGRVLGSVRDVTGVQSAAISINLPMDRSMVWDVSIPGQPIRPGIDAAFARIVSPGYFRTVGIPVRAGRDFDDRDSASTRLVVAINETLARRLGPNPLGQRLSVNGRDREVVAVVGDVKHRGLDRESGQEIYLSYAQIPGWQAFDLVARASDPMTLVPAIRAAIHRVDSEQAVGTPVPLQQLIDRTLKPRRVVTWLLGSFAAAALVIAAIGVYSILGYRVTQRARETAIRLALGASEWRVVSDVYRDGLMNVLLGVAIGLPCALLVGRAVQAFLFGLEPYDPSTLVGGLMTVLLVAVFGASGPARRAARVDVMTTLRME